MLKKQICNVLTEFNVLGYLIVSAKAYKLRFIYLNICNKFADHVNICLASEIKLALASQLSSCPPRYRGHQKTGYLQLPTDNATIILLFYLYYKCEDTTRVKPSTEPRS